MALTLPYTRPTDEHWLFVEAFGANHQKLGEVDFSMIDTEVTSEMVLMILIDNIADEQGWGPGSLKGKSDDECMQLLGITYMRLTEMQTTVTTRRGAQTVTMVR